MTDGVLRILDANLNRAREALRVIEDYARYARDDSDAARRLKSCRHRLLEFQGQFDAAALLAARDIAHDVGRDGKTTTEMQREDEAHVVRAAFARLTEALRSLSEFAKPASAAAAALAEAIRYEAYAIEQGLISRGPRRARLRAARVYVLLTADLCSGDWFATAEACLRGGADCLQLREKSLPDRELLDRACRLRELTRAHDVMLFINDRPDIARLADADGVHLGRDDLAVREARRILGGDALISITMHSDEELADAADADIDAIAIGPMFPSTTKPGLPAGGRDLLRHARKQVAVPLLAIGGITSDNARDIFAAGADCICACAAVISAIDIENATRALRKCAPP